MSHCWEACVVLIVTTKSLHSSQEAVDITTVALFHLFSMCWFMHRPLHMEGRERVKKKAAHSRLVGGRSNKTVSLLTRLSCMKTRWVDLHTYPENLKSLYRGLSCVSCVFSLQGLSNTLLSLGTGPTMRAAGRGQGRGWGALIPRASSRVNLRSRPLADLFHHFLLHSWLLQSCMSPFHNVPWMVSKGFPQHGSGLLGGCLAALKTDATV